MNLPRSLVIMGTLLLAACHSAEPPAAKPLPADGSSLASVTVEPAQVPDEVRLDGALEAIFKSTIAAQTNARVEELPFDVGDYVEKGQVVVRFRGTEQQARAASAQAAVREAEARLTDARNEYKRVKELVARKVLSEAALDKATAGLKSAQARVEAARAGAREAGEQAANTVVRAPYSGILLERHIEVGETATVGKPLLTGLSLEHLRAAVEVPQQSIGAVYAKRRARVILPDGSSVEATQLRISPAADPQTHTFRVLVTLPEGQYGTPQTVFPGTLVKVAFLRNEKTVLAVPASAILHRSELSGVYVIDADGRLSLRYVSLGAPLADGRVPVLAGLSVGEKIAADPVAAAQAMHDAAVGKPVTHAVENSSPGQPPANEQASPEPTDE